MTPHHAQRYAVLRQLAELKISEVVPGSGKSECGAVVDTVEKMQGQECDLTIACYGGLVDFEDELDFVFSFERINTAVRIPTALGWQLARCQSSLKSRMLRVCITAGDTRKEKGHSSGE